MSISNYELAQKAEAVLKAYRNHVENDLERAIGNLGDIVSQIESDEAKRRFFTDFLWSKRGDEWVKPPRSGNDPRPGLPLIIRSWARFGPTDELPAYLFSILGFEKGSHDFWEREILPAFREALQGDAENFTDDVVKTIDETLRTTGRDPDGTLRSEFETLARMATQVLYGRFRKTLASPAAKSAPGDEQQRDELSELVTALGVDAKVSAAIRRCREHLDSEEEFAPKAAGDLLRGAMDTVSRAIVAELEKVTAVPFTERDGEESRRNYLLQANFINQHERKFFTAIYSLISNEASHQLDAPKETVLVMERTVTDYLVLMLRRLLDRKSVKATLGKGT